jgi:phage-related protein
MATFNWLPDWGVSKSQKPRVLRYQFGDGYEQRRGDGINSNLEEWSCTFKRNVVEVELIDTFLKQMGGTEAFNWVTPDGRSAVFVCDSHSVTKDDYGWSTLSATFREVPEVALP